MFFVVPAVFRLFRFRSDFRRGRVGRPIDGNEELLRLFDAEYTSVMPGECAATILLNSYIHSLAIGIEAVYYQIWLFA